MFSKLIWMSSVRFFLLQIMMIEHRMVLCCMAMNMKPVAEGPFRVQR